MPSTQSEVLSTRVHANRQPGMVSSGVRLPFSTTYEAANDLGKATYDSSDADEIRTGDASGYSKLK